MAEAVLHPDPQLLPPGTTVKVYAIPLNAPSGYTPTVVLSEPTVTAGGVLTVTGLEESPQRYEARATVEGAVHQLRFAVSEQSSGGGGVESVNTKTGKVVLSAGDVGAVGTASPAFTGTPTAPTAAPGANTTQLATTAFSAAAVALEKTRAEGAEALKLAAASNLSDLASAATARTNLGLGTAATQASTAFDAAGLAATEQARAEGKEAEAVKLTGNQTVAGIKTFSSAPIVPTPTEAGQAVTKAYADAISAGLSPKLSATLATAAALPTNAYVAGVLTGVAFGALTVDGTAVTVGMRLLVKNEVAKANNGLYAVTNTGAVAEAYVLTRTTDMNTGAEVPGAFSFVESGTVNEGAGFVVVGPGPYTLGTTAITWTQFSGAGEITAGTGLTKSGNTLSLAVPAGSVTRAQLVTGVQEELEPKILEHSFAIPGEISASEYPGIFIKVGPHEQKKLIGVKVQLLSGTSTKYELRKNKAALEGYEGLEALSTEAKTVTNTKTLADGDLITLTPSTLVGKPSGLMVTLYLEQIP